MTAAARAREIIATNDRGGHTVPTAGLYPFQWNWDSAFVALGMATYDLDRAWTELATLLAAQRPDGMVPHIIFHGDDAGYFPGPEVWDAGGDPPTSGITQPPVAATAALALALASPDGLERVREVFQPLVRWSRWFHLQRDPKHTGLVAITHPWESGRDNSPAWDAPLAAVPVPADLAAYERRDLDHVDGGQRPTQDQYDRFLALVRHGRERRWDQARIVADSPFLVVDPGTVFILLRADIDLLQIAEMLGDHSIVAELRGHVRRTKTVCERLWNAAAGGYCALDLRTNTLAPACGSDAMLAWHAGVSDDRRLAQLADTARAFLDAVPYGLPSWDPRAAGFEPQRYWRGPVWAVVNLLVARGLAERDENVLARRVRGDTIALCENEGFCEYYDPTTGTGCGGGAFSWTAAAYLRLLADSWGTPTWAR